MNPTILCSVLALLQTLEPFGEPKMASTPPIPKPAIINHRRTVTRRLRGDWERPDMVALAYSTAWPEALVTIVEYLRTKTQLLLIVPQGEDVRSVSMWLNGQDRAGGVVSIAALDVDTGWVRDYGPLQTRDASGRIIWLDADYSFRPGDDAAPHKLAERFHVPIEIVPEALEGGALISNGRGLCVSTVESFAQNGISPEETDAIEPFLEQIGCQTLVLVPALSLDPTKHADMFAQFLSADTLAIASFDPATAPSDAARMDQAAALIARAAKSQHLALHVARIPHPDPVGDIYYSYLNGLHVGNAFLVPQYNNATQEEETRAYLALSEVAPGLDLLPVPADEMITLSGAVHCVTLGLAFTPIWVASTPSPHTMRASPLPLDPLATPSDPWQTRHAPQ